MKCPACASEQTATFLRCARCGHEFQARDKASKAVTVGLSSMAVWSMICAILAPFFAVTLAVAGLMSEIEYAAAAGVLTGTVISAVALILGVVALVRIGVSGGRLTGRGFGAIGVTIPVVEGLFFVLLAMSPRMHGLAPRLKCATNLSEIGQAMLIYANDYDDMFPLAPGVNGRWVARMPWWAAEDRLNAYGLSDPNAADGRASVSASLYLLVKYGGVPAASFVCKGDSGTTEFQPGDYGLHDRALADLWDFGPNPPLHCSYAYHMPSGPYRLTTSSEPGMPVAADRNPWIDSPFAKAQDFSRFKPDIVPFGGTGDEARRGNAVAHKGDGQNVLFLDSHVEFAKRVYCGLEDDNVYTSWNGDDKARGTLPKLGSQPADKLDSLLVNDPAVVGGGQ